MDSILPYAMEKPFNKIIVDPDPAKYVPPQSQKTL